MAIKIAPAVTKPVPTTAEIPNVSPSMILARRALKIKLTAPKGARMTMGNASSWKMVEKILEVM